MIAYDTERLLLIEEAAPLIGISPVTLRSWCSRGRFPCRRLPGSRRFLIPSADMEAFLNGATLDVKHLADNGLVVSPRKTRK